MDQSSRSGIIKAAKEGLGINHDFSEVQCSSLIQIHEAYLNWENSRGWSLSKAEIKKAEKATLKYKETLRECGIVGEVLIRNVVENAKKFIRIFNEGMEFDKEFFQEIGQRNPYSPKRGNPGNPKLRWYIYQMTWYTCLDSFSK